MRDVSPKCLLQNLTVTRPLAPWCDVLDNLELGVILLTQPWVAGDGIRRAELERQLAELASSFPFGGPLYFQRISRAVVSLERRGVLKGSGAGRERQFVLKPEGFAALILNLHVLRADPTLDGSEFELKRELVAMWNIMVDRLLTSLPQVSIGSEIAGFFAQLDALTILGRPVITQQVLKEAFDVLRLIAHQRDAVSALKAQSEARLTETRSQMELLRTADLSQLDFKHLGGRIAILKDHPEMLEVIRGIVTSAAPELSVEAQVARYDAYLKYLENLERMYSRALKVVDITNFRRRVAGSGDSYG